MSDDAKDDVSSLLDVAHLCEGGRLSFWCPACDSAHVVSVEGPGAWEFNKDLVRPTLHPSILVRGKHYIGGEGADPTNPANWPDVHCHCFVREGNIIFCDDSQHGMRGQTLALQPF